MHARFISIGLLAALVAAAGCVESQRTGAHRPFEAVEHDAVLAIVVDQSGSFAGYWDDKAHRLFLELMDQFFTEGAGEESRVVLAQLSGSDEVVLFEGSPAELRERFRTPEDLNAHLRRSADPGASQVYRATDRVLRYVSAMPGVTDQTRLMTVMLSDLVETGVDRHREGAKMLAALTRYREQGGGLALYYVAKEETPRWREILGRAGFEPGSYVIEGELVARPQLPSFD